MLAAQGRSEGRHKLRRYASEVRRKCAPSAAEYRKGAPVDSFVTPEPWDMPGYSDKVIMAAGAFTNGASIELSADGPLRAPYAVWMQGGITYTSGKLGAMLAAQEMLESK